MSDRIEAELALVREKLLEAIEVNRYKVRTLERQMGVPPGTRRKVVNGDVTLFFRHVLEILDAIGMPSHQFFAAAFPPPGKEGPSLKLGEAEPAAEIPPELAAFVQRQVDARLQEKVLEILDTALRLKDEPRDPPEKDLEE
jgi:hypothetical protein